MRNPKSSALLIETASWLLLKELMTLDDIVIIMKNYDRYAKTLKKDRMPIKENLILASMFNMSRCLPRPVYILWFKRCQRYLDCFVNGR